MILWEDCNNIGSPAGLKISKFYIFKDTSGFLPEMIKEQNQRSDYHAHRTG